MTTDSPERRTHATCGLYEMRYHFQIIRRGCYVQLAENVARRVSANHPRFYSYPTVHVTKRRSDDDDENPDATRFHRYASLSFLLSSSLIIHIKLPLDYQLRQLDHFEMFDLPTHRRRRGGLYSHVLSEPQPEISILLNGLSGVIRVGGKNWCRSECAAIHANTQRHTQAQRARVGRLVI